MIARDGANRYEEYEAGSGERIAYLENAGGYFVLLPSSKSYADLLAGTADPTSPNLDQDVTTNPAGGLLDRTEGETTYEKLGAEQLNGRQTTKYRVTYVSNPNATAGKQEAFVWVDEALGMPIRSETNYADS
ncbi:MAG: hypothetical protein ACRD6N_10110, partial [Pyrinomonadaceae bacterium]